MTVDLVGVVLAWTLAEYFTRRRRMSLPSIALATFFALNVAGFLFAARFLFAPASPEVVTHHAIVIAAGGLVAMLAYFRRFRLPFATFLIGLFGAGLVFALASLIDPEMFGDVRSPAAAFFDLRSSPTAALATLVFGAAAFLAAMRFDLRDPHRVSRHSASAFWLHLLAAPALVNTLAFTLYRLGGAAGYVVHGARPRRRRGPGAGHRPPILPDGRADLPRASHRAGPEVRGSRLVAREHAPPARCHRDLARDVVGADPREPLARPPRLRLEVASASLRRRLSGTTARQPPGRRLCIARRRLSSGDDSRQAGQARATS